MSNKVITNKFSILPIVVLSAVLLVGIYSSLNTMIKGQVLFGSSDQVPWNMLIAAYVFLALTASGLCLISNFFEVIGIKRYHSIQKRAHFLAVAFLLPALVVLSTDLGRIERVIYFLISPNFASPMWWMGTVYAIYLVLLLIEFWALHVGNKKAAKVLSVLTLLGAVSAISILGGIFSVFLHKSLWFGAATPIFFVLSALISGISAFFVAVYLTFRFEKAVIPAELQQIMKELSLVLVVMLAIAMGFNVWRLITVQLGVPDFAVVLAGGSYSIVFWSLQILVGIIFPFFILLRPKNRTQFNLAVSGFMVLIGMFVDKYLFVISGQLVQPYGTGNAVYHSTFTEWSIFISGLAATILLYWLGQKYFSLDRSVDNPPENINPFKAESKPLTG